MRKLLALLLIGPVLLVSGPVEAAPTAKPETVVTHGITKSFRFTGDICGPRGDNTTTFQVKTEQVHLRLGADGTFNYHDVGVVTYVQDFDDPAMEDLTGRLTEVNRFTFTRGDVFTATTAFHDFFGTIRIFVSVHITEVKGELVVERFLEKVTGCP